MKLNSRNPFRKHKTLRELSAFVREQLNLLGYEDEVSACASKNYTLSLTEQFCTDNDISYSQLFRFLDQHGITCDCRVAYYFINSDDPIERPSLVVKYEETQ